MELNINACQILFYSVQYKIKGGRKRIPKIYGVYRRNALTLNQTFGQGIIKLTLIMGQMTLNMMSQRLDISPATTRQIYMTNVMLLIMVDGVLFPIYILLTLRHRHIFCEKIPYALIVPRGMPKNCCYSRKNFRGFAKIQHVIRV